MSKEKHRDKHVHDDDVHDEDEEDEEDDDDVKTIQESGDKINTRSNIN